jgi:hypothetical protein
MQLIVVIFIAMLITVTFGEQINYTITDYDPISEFENIDYTISDYDQISEFEDIDYTITDYDPIGEFEMFKNIEIISTPLDSFNFSDEEIEQLWPSCQD